MYGWSLFWMVLLLHIKELIDTGEVYGIRVCISRFLSYVCIIFIKFAHYIRTFMLVRNLVIVNKMW